MEPTTAALIAIPVVLVIVVMLVARSRRDRSLEPVRLGPRWEQPGASDEPARDMADDDRVGVLVQRTGLDAHEVAVVLQAWDEHLAVLGFFDLPAGHRYLVYDPYDPPVVGRGPDNRPVADKVRVARDVERRTSVSEIDARTVLDALLDDPDDVVA